MSTKSRMQELLEANRDKHVSGEEAAQSLGISRAAVWKAMQSLKEQGLEIESVPGVGYRLASGSDMLSAEAVRPVLANRAHPVRVLEEVDSTNLEAKRWAIDGAPHGAMVLAERQTAGRGRLGRGFTSPPGGLYLSVVLRPDKDYDTSSVSITAAAAVAVCRAVSRTCGIELGIKWVNDLFYQQKKCCGILSEAGTSIETGGFDYIVVGMGLNYSVPAFPPELEDIAVSLFPPGQVPVPRAHLAAAIHDELLDLYDHLAQRTFMLDYRSRSIVPGHEVTVMDDPPWHAKAVGIDGEARLMVQKPDGSIVNLSYGEISIKM